MATISLLALPVELIYYIFDHCDIQNFLSIRCVCKQLYILASNYDRFKLCFNSESPYNVDSIPSFVQPENVTALILSNDSLKTDRIKEFSSVFKIKQFIKLYSLNLRHIQDDDLEHLLQHVSTDYLVSLLIESSQRVNCRAWSFVLPLLTRCNLRKLSMRNIDYTMKNISWPDQCRLQHLIIDNCIYSEYLAILQGLPNLRRLVMQNCTINDENSTLFLLSKFKIHSSLMSLTINDYSRSLENLTLLLSPISKLQHLKLISHRTRLDSFFNGSHLQELIQVKAPTLVRFEFLLSYKYHQNDDFINLESLMSPFRTSFWLAAKRWLVTCAYVPKAYAIWLHTTPIRDTGIERSVRCEVSWVDQQCRLTQRSIDEIVENTDDPTLTTINLYHNQIGDRGVQYFADALRCNTTLTTFGLYCNQIGDKGAQVLVDALQQNTTLTTLSLHHNHIGDKGAQYFADILLHNTTFITLNLNDNHIGEKGVQYLADGLRQNTTLTSLNLDKNFIRQQGVKYLADSLQQNKALITLSLCHNQIGDSGTQYLTDALRHNKTLLAIILDKNLIGDQGAKRLADALRHNTTLATLSLNDNQIEDEGAKRLADALRHNATLTVLNLKENQIGHNGIKRLAESLRTNTTLKEIQLWNNTVISTKSNELRKLDSRLKF